MLTVTSRKVGHSVFLPIPKQFHVEPGEEFVVHKSQNGGLIFAPRIPNPFLSDIPYKEDEVQIFQDIAQEDFFLK